MQAKVRNTWLYNFRRTIDEHYAESKSSFYLYMILRLIIFVILAISIIDFDIMRIVQALSTLVIFLMVPLFEKTFKANFPPAFKMLILILAFSANILGEIFELYAKIPSWDTMLHTLYGFIFAALGFSLLDLYTKDEKLKFNIHPSFFVISSIGFTLGLGVLWEFFECAMDYFFGKDMQKDTVVHFFQSTALDETNSNIPIYHSNIHETIIDGKVLPIDGYLDIGLYDTIIDLAVAFFGAAIFCIFLVAFLKTKGNNKIASSLMPTTRDWKEKPAVVKVGIVKKIFNIEENEIDKEEEK